LIIGMAAAVMSSPHLYQQCLPDPSEHDAWDPTSLVLQIEDVGEGGGLGCLDWLPPAQPGALSDFEAQLCAEPMQDLGPSQTICPSPVFSDGSDLEDVTGTNADTEEHFHAVQGGRSGQLSGLRRSVSFGSVHTRLVVNRRVGGCAADGCSQPERGGGAPLPAEHGMVVDWPASHRQDDHDCGTVVDCLVPEPVKCHDGPNPVSLLLEVLIRRHHAGTIADGDGAAVLEVCRTTGLRCLEQAAQRLELLLQQIDCDGSCGILPSMIRLEVEHAVWLRSLLSLLKCALELQRAAKGCSDRRRKHCSNLGSDLQDVCYATDDCTMERSKRRCC